MGDTYSLLNCKWNDGYQNKSFFWGRGLRLDGQTKGGVKFHLPTNYLWPVSAVQFSGDL